MPHKLSDEKLYCRLKVSAARTQTAQSRVNY